MLLSQTTSRWAHLDSVHVQQNIESSHSKDSPLTIHTLQLFFLKKTMLYSFHTFTVSLSCSQSEIDENFLAVNWGTYWKADLSDLLWFYETILFWLVKSRLIFLCENAKDLPLPHFLHPSPKPLKIEMIKLLSFFPQVCRSNSLISNSSYKKEESPSKERGNIKLLGERSQVVHFAYSFLIECVLCSQQTVLYSRSWWCAEKDKLWSSIYTPSGTWANQEFPAIFFFLIIHQTVIMHLLYI